MGAAGRRHAPCGSRRLQCTIIVAVLVLVIVLLIALSVSRK